MNKTILQIAGQIGCSESTIRTLLGRAEFAHIHKVWNSIKRRTELESITQADLERLALWVNRKRRGKQK